MEARYRFIGRRAVASCAANFEGSILEPPKSPRFPEVVDGGDERSNPGLAENFVFSLRYAGAS